MAFGNERRVLDELPPLVRVVGQHLARPADEAGRGLVAGAGDDVHVREDLLAREPARRSGLVHELGVQHLGHQVVRGMLGAPIDVVGEHLAAREFVFGVPHRLAGLGAQGRVGVVADRFLVLLRDPEQHADHPHRHLCAEIRDEVEPARADERVEARCAELADLRFERVHLPRREHPRQQRSVHGVDRRILEDEDARRHLDVRLDQLDDAAPTGDVGLPVDESPFDVVEPADREEVVDLVVVERRLLAQPPVHGIRIGVDPDVVRVVVDVTRAGRRHWTVPFSARSSTIRDGVSGKRVIVTPNGASASATALTTAGGAPIAPPSPTPL